MKKMLVALVALVMAVAAVGVDKKALIKQNLTVFNELYKELTAFYVDSIDAKKSIETAIEAMLSDIDPYTEYIAEDRMDYLKQLNTGEYGGIGSLILERDGATYISAPAEGSPSQRAGLRPGDKILTIDGDTVLGLPSADVSKRLRGQAGTPLKVVVSRPYVGADSIMTFDIVRGLIKSPTVEWSGVIGDSIGYIALSSFNEHTPDEVKEALLAIKQYPGVKGLVLDMRGNVGGLVGSAVKLLSYILPKGVEVLKMRGRDAMEEKTYRTFGPTIDQRIPLVILVDGGTASSAEIVAGAVQDLDRGVIIGNRTFGKGLVQSTRNLPYGNVLKVTTAKYYIPSGRLIQAIDYSRRNTDGSVERIPDSLTHVFQTVRGREVRDGGGITPDVEIETPEINRLIWNLVRDNWIFDYANRYAATHATIAPADSFVITDEIFADFKSTIDPERFKYDRMCELILKQLREAADTEGYMNDSVAAQLDVLDGMLKHNLDHDLDRDRALIESFLRPEIAERYYYSRGRNRSVLIDDVYLRQAIEVLNDRKLYESLLAPAKKK